MKLPNVPIQEYQQQAKELLASLNGLSEYTAKSDQAEIFDAILESSKNRIEGEVENVKVAFDYYMKQQSDISPDDETELQV